jgi:nuclear transcription Y subunit beta
MPSSPSKDLEDPGVQSGDEGIMDREGDTGGYEFDVKEQDRWLPIANGTLIVSAQQVWRVQITRQAKQAPLKVP